MTARECCRFSLLLLFLLPLSCSDSDSPESPPILVVDGMAVTLYELEAQIEFERTFRPDTTGKEKAHPAARSDEELKVEIITKKLIPFAAAKNAYRDKIPGLLEKAEEARGQVNEDRSNFASLSSKLSAKSTAASRGRLGYISRNCGLPYPLPQKAFSMKAGELSEPFLSQVGCHVLYVQKIEEGANDSGDRVLAFQIVLPYEDRDDFVHEVLPRLASGAVVEVKDPAYARYVETAAEQGNK